MSRLDVDHRTDFFATTIGDDRRWRRRKSTLWAAELVCGANRYKCLVLNVSHAGAMLELAAPPALPQSVSLEIEGRRRLEAELVWQLPDKIGVQFTDNADYIAGVLGDMSPH